MLTAEGCALRRKRLWDALPAKCDLLLIADPSHLVYFANFLPSPFEFRSVESSGLLLMQPDHATLVADDMVGPFVEKAFADEKLTPTWYDGQHTAPPRRANLLKAAIKRVSEMPGTRIGVERGAVPSGLVEHLRESRPGLEIVDLDPIIRPLRRSKDADEIALLKRAMFAAEQAHAWALAEARPKMSERDIYNGIVVKAIKALEDQAFVYGDFASGPRTATDKGGPPTSRKIEPGDLLLLDFSVVVGGYRCDFANTFVVDGQPTSAQRDLYQACVGAMHAGESLLKPGTPAKDVDAAVRGHFTSLKLDQFFPHHTGHGIGLGHPEPPYFVPASSDILQAGDVVTIEPGLYVENTGGMRYERNYLITSSGFEVLSNHEIRIDQH